MAVFLALRSSMGNTGQEGPSLPGVRVWKLLAWPLRGIGS